MVNKDIEIELKFPLLNFDETVIFLEENATPLKKNISQKDFYFIPPHRDFLSVNYPFEWLRLRESEKGFSLDYKHFYPENAEKTDYCDEFQTKMENIEAMKKILKSLDFKEVVIVDKIRSTWIFKDVEIAIDDIKKLGRYIELEAKKHFNDPKEGKTYLYSILKELNAKVGEEELRGYPYRIIEKMKNG